MNHGLLKQLKQLFLSVLALSSVVYSDVSEVLHFHHQSAVKIKISPKTDEK
jgi:hypothetical protein